jgi:hypothetical protein
MRLRSLQVVAGFVLVGGVAIDAQQHTGQIRSHAAAARQRPSGDALAPSGVTLRPRPISPSRGLAFPLPVIPITWGWATLPVSVTGGTPFTLQEGPTGGVQLDVQPWRASVFVDGVYKGRVDEFNGYYRNLQVVAGPHLIVVVEPGYRPLVFDVVVVPGRTTTYRGTLNDDSAWP